MVMRKPNFILASISAVLALSVMACTPKTDNATKTADSTTSNQVASSAIYQSEVSLGEVSQRDHRVPVRGLLIAPVQADKPVPLIVISHLRAPNCTDKTFAYPCANGVSEMRYDLGMAYLGEQLAQQGYAVMIPDLGGVFVGDDVHTPYDQAKLWQQVLGKFITHAKEQINTKAIAPVDFTNVGLFVHSRSGQMVDAAGQLFGKDSLKSVFAYAPAYDTVELEFISPVPADVPYLAVAGSLDADVGSSVNLWLGHYASTPRQTPASVVELPALGHMYINRAASEIGFDDRIGCDVLACADAKTHERIVTELTSDWFASTLLGKASDLPMRADMPLSDKVAGETARWLSLTPKAIGFVEPKDWTDVQSGKGVMVCAHADPMNPVRPKNACPEPEHGFVQILTPVAHLSGISSAKTQIQGVRGVSLQLAPTDSHQGVQGTAVSLTLHTANHTTTIELPANHPALISRQSEHDNGTYRLGTVRVPLPPDITKETITQITLDPKHPIYVRSVDFW